MLLYRCLITVLIHVPILFVLSSCATLGQWKVDYSNLTPSQVQQMILKWTPYNGVIGCRQRALIAVDYLLRSNYYAELRINPVYEKIKKKFFPNGEHHAFVYWKKGMEEGFILDQLKEGQYILNNIPKYLR